MIISKFLSPKNDVAFKRIFGSEEHKNILIHFINDILERSGDSKIEEVEFLPTAQNPDIAYRKQSIVDVLCRTSRGEQIIVEMQVSPEKGFEKRAQYYAAKAYSSQLNKGSGEDGKYINLKEIIFIAISDYIVFADKAEYISHHVILDKHSYEHDLRDFSFSFIELPKFKKTAISDLGSIIEKWCYFFKYADATKESAVIDVAGDDSVIRDAYEALNQFNWTEAELYSYERELKRIRDNQAAEDYMIDKGIEIGRAQGIQEGKVQGIQEGIEKGTHLALEKTAIRMLQQGAATEFIKQVTDLSDEVISKLKASI